MWYKTYSLILYLHRKHMISVKCIIKIILELINYDVYIE